MSAADPSKRKPGKRGKGRPKFTPSRNARMMVEVMTATGTPHNVQLEELIATRLIDPDPKGRYITINTFKKAFAEELEDGKRRATARLGRSIYSKALGNKPGSAQLAMFWMQTQGVRVDPSWQKVDAFSFVDRMSMAQLEALDFGIFSDEEMAAIRAGRITDDLIAKIQSATAHVQPQVR